MADQIITQEYLHEIFDYKDGVLYWKKLGKGRRLSLRVGSFDKDGYIQISINHKKYKAHRLIFMMFYGYIPEYLDHVDGNPANNLIENLRPATLVQNQHNRIIGKNNKSGYKNVYWTEKNKKWVVALKVNKKNKWIGCFEDIELADLVAQEARNKYNGDFANHGYKR